MAESLQARGQAQRMSAEVRRQQIVAVAADLFSQKGFSGTTTKEIADGAGVSEAIIFRHFSTKRDLYHAIIDYKTRQSSQDMQAELEEAAARNNDREFFRILATRKLEFYCEDPALMRLLLFSALEGHELTEIFFQSTTREVRNYIRHYIERRVAEGAFRRVDPAVAARAFLGMVANQAQVQILFKPCDDLTQSSTEIVDFFVDIFLDGIKREPLLEDSATGPGSER
jgi:AcrR family transcriptional regulator